MPEDIFKNFGELRRALVIGEDYEFVVRRRISSVAIIAPHGGEIEISTSQIANAIADEVYNLYCFEGLKKRPHHEIHITSHKFDEQNCIDLISQCDFVVAVHGRNDHDDENTIFMGGLDTGLRNAISDELKNVHLPTQLTGHKFPAINPMNICNRGRRKMGVQMELPRTLRSRLSKNKKHLDDFSKAVRAAITSYSAALS